MPILILILAIVLAILCGTQGSKKGYSFGLCLAAGIFGSWLALIMILLLPDRAQEQLEFEAQIRRQEERIAALNQRIAELEAAKPRKSQSEKAPAPQATVCTDGPVTFPARTEDFIVCPHCGKSQRGNRNLCYFCETPFQYEDE